MKPKTYPLVYIEWEDHCSDDSTWKEFNEQEFADPLPICISVGFLIHEDKAKVVIVGDFSGLTKEDEGYTITDYSRAFFIAKKLIKKRIVLTESPVTIVAKDLKIKKVSKQ